LASSHDATIKSECCRRRERLLLYPHITARRLAAAGAGAALRDVREEARRLVRGGQVLLLEVRTDGGRAGAQEETRERAKKKALDGRHPRHPHQHLQEERPERLAVAQGHEAVGRQPHTGHDFDAPQPFVT